LRRPSSLALIGVGANMPTLTTVIKHKIKLFFIFSLQYHIRPQAKISSLNKDDILLAISIKK